MFDEKNKSRLPNKKVKGFFCFKEDKKILEDFGAQDGFLTGIMTNPKVWCNFVDNHLTTQKR